MVYRGSLGTSFGNADFSQFLAMILLNFQLTMH